MGEFTKVATTTELAPGNIKKLEIAGREIALYNVDGQYYATSNICPHQGGPLDEGILEGTSVVCPWHAWAFDVCNGVSPVNPRAKIDCYPVKVEGTDILIKV
jgi:nitrite reductase/ring-hydroxylating ferredoxin subunit